MKRVAVALCLFATLAGAGAATARAQTHVTVRFMPTKHVQLAVWLESADDPTRFRTMFLTQATAYRGIGNRPGALAMNSGYRWPYGRREGVLPVWAHRRVELAGQPAWRRVIFRNRREGAASQAPLAADTYVDYADPYFCLDFHDRGAHTDDDVHSLDAISCASTYNSDRGRYATAEDVASGYAEPTSEPGGVIGSVPLGLESLYPPRRDIAACVGAVCGHPDAYGFASDAVAVMPELDGVTSATPVDGEVASTTIVFPEDWPPGHYRVLVEANTEADYDASYGPIAYPGPPDDGGTTWDWYAFDYGFAYRGQPSIVYRVDFDVPTHDDMMDVVTSMLAVGHGSVDGRGGDDATMYDMSDGTMETTVPGSGAQRLLPLDATGSRVRLEVRSPMYCMHSLPPAAITDLAATPSDDVHHSHEFAHLHFTAPWHDLDIAAYEVRVSTRPITDDASFDAAVPANAASIDTVALVVPTTAATGSVVDADLGGLYPLTHYWVGVRPSTECQRGPIAVAELDTTAIHFTTVSPCFVATAAYGTPMAGEVGALRRFRDRQLRTNAAGRAAVAAYYRWGPRLAEAERGSEGVRAAVRTALRPLVALAHAIDD